MLLYTPPKAPISIPVIDLAPSFSGSADGKVATAHDVHRAARQTGFFYVKNHGIDPALVAGAYEAARDFFALPLDKKMAVRQVPGSARGYERLEGQMLDMGSPGDLKEGYTLAGEIGPDHPYAGMQLPELAPNQWPDLPGFREALLAYRTPMLDLGLHVMRLIALSLDMPESFFDESYRYANPSLRIHRYPPQPEDAAFNQLGAGAHTDWGVITLLAQDMNGGLEVQNAAGEWIRAEPIADTFVVNLGDMIARWTNDLYQSTMHRVMNDRSGGDRYSMALFYNPHYHTRVECLPTCMPQSGVPNYPPCTAGDHINEKRLIALGLR